MSPFHSGARCSPQRQDRSCLWRTLEYLVDWKRPLKPKESRLRCWWASLRSSSKVGGIGLIFDWLHTAHTFEILETLSLVGLDLERI